MTQLVPTATQEREQFMDVLRGFAILGIFIANLANFSWYFPDPANVSPWLLPGPDHTMSFLHHMFIEGKFYSIFSLLFGWGVALQIRRGEARGIDAVPVVKRRLRWMLVLGAVHLMIWSGDIVFFYALLGFLLVALRKLSDRAMLTTGAILILLPIVLYALKLHWPVLAAPSGIMFQTGSEVLAKTGGVVITSDTDIAAYLAKASWWEVLKTNLAGFFYRYGYLFFVSRIPKVLGVFLIGYALGRSGFYNRIGEHKKTLYTILAVGLLVGLPANYILATFMSDHGGDYFQLTPNGLYQTIAYAFGVVPLALAYVAILVLLFRQLPRLLSIFASVGKMAFSNYIMQSIIGSVVFLGAGFGFIGKVGPVYYTLFGLCVFIVQIILSHMWLKYFNYGPVEYLWRSATYKQWQQMRKTN